jgi:2,5-diketo-D-gluconate reductase A
MGIMEIPSVDLGSGTPLPMIGFGTWQLGGRQAYDSVRLALDCGYRHIDTATLYGNEEEVGRALRDSGLARDEVYLTTKLRPRDTGREQRILAQSLRALGTDHLDLWLVHWPPSDRELVPVWREFVAAQDKGLTRAIGVSNYSPQQIDLLAEQTGVRPAVNQIPWSPRRHDARLLEEHRRRGVVVEGYSPLKNTNLNDPVLTEIARAHGVTPAQVVLKWHLQHDIVILPRSGNRERIAQNLDLFAFDLTPAEITEIDEL